MFLPPASTVHSVAATGDTIADSIDYLNAMRHNVGYPAALSIDKGLATSSQSHANYLAYNSIFSHTIETCCARANARLPRFRVPHRGRLA